MTDKLKIARAIASLEPMVTRGELFTIAGAVACAFASQEQTRMQEEVQEFIGMVVKVINGEPHASE
jgi:hypothetical protein